MIPYATRAFCKSCGEYHDATVERQDNNICGVLHCPQGDQQWVISSQADVYLAFRERSLLDVARPAAAKRALLNFLPITTACNLDCTVCGADADTKTRPRHLSLQETVERSHAIGENGGKYVNLFGGEPSLHPQLLKIVECLANRGFNLGMATNGLRLGRRPSLARDLKNAGLSRIGLQFDSLQPATLERLGRNYLPEKMAALQAAVDAGLRVGLNCTVTKHNVDELPALVDFAVSWAPHVYNLSCLSAAPTGRFGIAVDDSVDREQMIEKILQTSTTRPLNTGDFMVFPAFAPWGLEVHPDCGVSLPLVVHRGRATPANEYIDIDDLCRRLATTDLPPNLFSQAALPTWHLLRSLRQDRLGKLLPALAHLVGNRGRTLLNVGVTNYKSAHFLDQQKIDRCACRFYTSQGPVRGCHYFFRDEEYPGSRQNELQQKAS
jgi:MoaA/NifB/PqqE/SkfB family radical SAM enzyme